MISASMPAARRRIDDARPGSAFSIAGRFASTLKFADVMPAARLSAATYMSLSSILLDRPFIVAASLSAERESSIRDSGASAASTEADEMAACLSALRASSI